MLSDGVKKLNTNIQLVNGDFYGDLKSCMTGQVESLHATHHHKHETGAHVIDYARGFGNTAGGLPIISQTSLTILCHPILLAFGTSHFCHLYQMFRWTMRTKNAWENGRATTEKVYVKVYERKQLIGKNTFCNPFCPWSRWNPVGRNMSKPRGKPGGWVKWRKRFKWFGDGHWWWNWERPDLLENYSFWTKHHY